MQQACIIIGKLREAATKSFLVARPLTHPSPYPFKLSGHIFWGIFFRASKKDFFLIVQALIPLPLLVAGPRKKNFFRLPLEKIAIILYFRLTEDAEERMGLYPNALYRDIKLYDF